MVLPWPAWPASARSPPGLPLAQAATANTNTAVRTTALPNLRMCAPFSHHDLDNGHFDLHLSPSRSGGLARFLYVDVRRYAPASTERAGPERLVTTAVASESV